VLDILVKTQRKMSAHGRATALEFGVHAPVLALYERALQSLKPRGGFDGYRLAGLAVSAAKGEGRGAKSAGGANSTPGLRG
jgi:hypothetical protein